MFKILTEDKSYKEGEDVQYWDDLPKDIKIKTIEIGDYKLSGYKYYLCCYHCSVRFGYNGTYNDVHSQLLYGISDNVIVEIRLSLKTGEVTKRDVHPDEFNQNEKLFRDGIC